MTKRIVALLPLLILLLSFGCGGGGGGGGSSYSKVTISFSLISTATLPFRLSGFQLAGTLPAGVTVTTGDVNNPKLITNGLDLGSAITASAVSWQSLVFGSYSAPNRIRLVIADGTPDQAGFGPGEMVRLTCSITDGTAFSSSDLQALENAITFKASGWETPTKVSPLNEFLKPKVTVTLSN